PIEECCLSGAQQCHKLKELPFRIALQHLFRGEAVQHTFWKFPEPCLWSLTCSSWSFSGLMRKIPSA
ncbi:hypothetical protein U9M48_036790, partial [Paspalum notatum var. saurae]